MRHALWLFMLCCSLTVAAVDNPHDFPKGTLGLLQVDSLTRGELLWMQGRVGREPIPPLMPRGVTAPSGCRLRSARWRAAALASTLPQGWPSSS